MNAEQLKDQARRNLEVTLVNVLADIGECVRLRLVADACGRHIDDDDDVEDNLLSAFEAVEMVLAEVRGIEYRQEAGIFNRAIAYANGAQTR